MGWRGRSALGACLAFALASVVAARADATPRSVTFTYRYPSTTECAGVALYHSASRAEIDAGVNLVRVDLGRLPADSAAAVSAVVPGFEDTRDYYAVLRCYDGTGRESRNSGVGVIPASVVQSPAAGILYEEDFEEYQPAADPTAWLDSAPNVAAPGPASLFETAALGDGSIAFTAATASDIHSTLDAAGAGAWSSYEYTGRMESDELRGSGGVTVLSRYPEAQFYYRLARFASMPYVVTKRGNGALVCSGSASTGVTSAAGEWLQFRVRVTRFDGRNRVRASLWPDGAQAPAGWQVDCWDDAPEASSTGRIGVFSGGDRGSHWDDFRVASVTPDGAPSGYGGGTTNPPPSNPPPVVIPPPPPSGGSGSYLSASQLAHWWRPGWDLASLGKDFATSGGVDVARNKTNIDKKDVTSGGGSSNSELDLDGSLEALANLKLTQYGIGNTWTVAAWVRPGDMSTSKKPRYIFDMNAQTTARPVSRISLVLDTTGHFAVDVSDSQERLRSLASPTPINKALVPSAWYHVAAVKNGTGSLALYVNGKLVASTNVGVPAQTDVPRLLRIGGRVHDSGGYYWKGGVGSVALWRSALGASEVTALSGGGRPSDLRSAIAAR